jgi:N-acyl-D-amino-acid deacylase
MDDNFDILIRDGIVYDGSLSEPYVSDIGISEDKISFVGRAGRKKAKKTIDADGLIVCPGFIDAHAHSDFTIVADPRAEGKLFQGITTEINGNCGISAAPLYGKVFEKRAEDMRELGIAERWSNFEEYFSIIKGKGLAVNVAFLAGHGNIRGAVLGYDNIEATPDKSSQMAALLEEALTQGALGLSTGLIYSPGIYSSTKELVHLTSYLRSRDLIYTSHMRSEGNQLEEAVQEVIRIGEETGVRVHISHIKTAGEPNWGKAEDVISSIDDARGRGVRISCDRYPYVASSTDLDSILPAWAFEGGNEEELRRISDHEERGRIEAELGEQARSPDFWEKVVVSSVVSEKNSWMEGKTITLISRQKGKREIDTVFGLLLDEQLKVGAIFFSMTENNLKKFISLPYCVIGSDSSARSLDGPTRRGKPHPRGFGTFPRLFGKYVRREEVLSLSEAIHKSTQLAARTFGIGKRGLLRKGYYADIVIFDAAKIEDKATFEKPFQTPGGIGYVLVNGVPSVWEGIPSGRTGGKVVVRNSD